MKTYNTRVAPSPTGFFHLGTARTAYHNWLAAKASGGKFILRIDDTDNNRNNDGYTKVIFQSMDWLKIDYDITFTQSSRKNHYMDVANMLVQHDLAFHDDGAIRLKTNYLISDWNDFNANTMAVSQKDNDTSNNLVIIKSDGTPTYHFACVVDDIDYDINLIIRGADHISNTIKQIFIFKALAQINYPKADLPVDFSHVGLIMYKGKKMSKRDGASNLMLYKDNNYNPDAILNFILKLGWSHPDPQFDSKNPLINKDLAKQIFFDGKLRAANCSFDQNRLDWLNKKYR
jgi:glutamyl-tRNA synthetase